MTLAYENLSRPKQRAKVLLRTRNLKMARNAHAYVRGSTIKFYEWLETGGGKLPAGPSVWICGDCHLGNLGPLADSDGHVDVQIRDLDQTVIGNPVHDLVRLGLSLASAARGSDLPGVTTARMLEEMVDGYERAMAGRFDRRTEKNIRPKVIQAVFERSIRRTWKQLAEERIEDESPRFRSANGSGPSPTKNEKTWRSCFAVTTRGRSSHRSKAVATVTGSRCWTPPIG
jgi:uncharacterized protein (DUF2252 family)